jgi:hypothetical protein
MSYNVLNQPVVGSTLVTAMEDDAFFYPQRLQFTGFACDGYWYEAGIQNPAIQASWATETPGPTRAGTPSFPTNALVLISQASLSIFDISSGTVQLWMLFYKNDEFSYPTNFIATASSYSPLSVAWSSGVLSVLLAPDAGSVAQASALLAIDFSQDAISLDTHEPDGAVVVPSQGPGDWDHLDPGMVVANGTTYAGSSGAILTAGETITATTGLFVLQAVMSADAANAGCRVGMTNTAGALGPGPSNQWIAAGFVGARLDYQVNAATTVVSTDVPVLTANYVITLAYLGAGQLSITIYPDGDLQGLLAASATDVVPPATMTTFYVSSGGPQDTLSNIRYSTGRQLTLPVTPGSNPSIAPFLLSNYGGLLVITPTTYSNATTSPWLILCHDYQADIISTVQQTTAGMLTALLDAGYVIVLMNNSEGDSFGNAAAVLEFAAMVNQIELLFHLDATPFLGGIGMGALLALNAVQLGYVMPRAFVGFSPITALGAFYQSQAANADADADSANRQAAIEAAYNFSGADNQLAATDGYDPSLANPALLSPVPMILWQNTDDTVVSAADNAVAFAASIHAIGGNVSVISSIGGYLDGDEFDGATVVNFFGDF